MRKPSTWLTTIGVCLLLVSAGLNWKTVNLTGHDLSFQCAQGTITLVDVTAHHVVFTARADDCATRFQHAPHLRVSALMSAPPLGGTGPPILITDQGRRLPAGGGMVGDGGPPVAIVSSDWGQGSGGGMASDDARPH